ncbi:glycosyltransferase family 2 protein [Vibrio cincinnatiensis]|uniref:glycosyltransferase family 2 protein n=1 Tax=Vibrio cincinnatiensis TaxID=675 RepID=UPI0013028E93|nr:glycosyltransferase family 2 protein [Vibrio cincinnatiensis]
MRFSVVVPTYNGEKYIEETLNSIFNQSFEDYEVIIVDDCSTDNTVVLAKSFLLFERVTIIEKKSNNGLSDSVNIGVKIASGDIVICLGQDDILDRNHLKIIDGIYKKESNISITHNASIMIDSDNRPIGIFVDEDRIRKITENYKIEMCKRNIFQSCGLSFKRTSFLEAGGWDDSYKLFGEWLIYMKIARLGSLHFVPNLYSYYRRHETNITNGFSSLSSYISRREYFKKCRKEALKDEGISFIARVRIVSFHVFWDIKQLGGIFFDKCRKII